MKGINAHRLRREPNEKAFAQAWAKANEGNKLLKYLLDRTQSNDGRYIPSEAEEETAATIIQWLGSPVGMGFLEDVLTNLDPYRTWNESHKHHMRGD